MRILVSASIAASVTAALIIAGIAFAQPMYQSPLIDLPAGKGVARGSTCAYKSGGWTIVDCSAAAAASSALLTAWSRYVIQCGDDSYFAPGTASSGQDADSSDGWIASGAWIDFFTTDSVRYYSCLNKNVNSDCRHIECL